MTGRRPARRLGSFGYSTLYLSRSVAVCGLCSAARPPRTAARLGSKQVLSNKGSYTCTHSSAQAHTYLLTRAREASRIASLQLCTLCTLAAPLSALYGSPCHWSDIKSLALASARGCTRSNSLERVPTESPHHWPSPLALAAAAERTTRRGLTGQALAGRRQHLWLHVGGRVHAIGDADGLARGIWGV